MKKLALLWLLAGCNAGSGRADLAGALDLAAPDLAAAAADGGDDLSQPLPSVSASVRLLPECAVAAMVDITSERAVEVEVAFGATTAYGRLTPRLPAGGGVVSVPLFGLDPAAVTHLRATAYGATGQSASTDDIAVTTNALPSAIPALQVGTDTGEATGYLMVSVVQIGGGSSAATAVIYDRAGRIEWYRDQTPSSSRGTDFQQQPGGHWTAFQNGTLQFEEIDPAAQAVVGRWAASGSALGADGHELLLLPNQNAALFGVETHVDDTRPYLDGGVGDALVLHNSINEVTPDGGLAFHWETWPEIGLDETSDFTLLLSGSIDTAHANSLAQTADGNYLASFRQLDTLVKVDRSAARILWRLGGKKSDFTFINDPLGGFSHQHDARFLPGGDLLLLDNGNLHRPPVTRAVEYRLDETAHTATLVWQYRHAPDLFSFLAGNARRLANGNTVVAYASLGQVTEVDPFGRVVWEGKLVGKQLYRALPLASLYP
jgi:hypothetical protein